MITPTLYLRATPENTGDLVLMPGDPARVNLFSEQFPGFRVVSRNREYSIATGEYEGRRISVVSAGIGGPSTAIALEELKQLGVRAVVRIGTMMGVLAPMGSVIIPQGTIREEGTSNRYLPLSFPAVPNWELHNCLVDSARRCALDVRVGVSVSFDAFYPEMAPDLVGRRKQVDWELYRNAGVLSTDMETSMIFTVGQALGLPTAAMCLVTVQSGENTAFLNSETRSELEHRMLTAALQGILAYSQDH